MKRHASRADSGQHQFMMRVPRDVAERVKGRVVMLDLPASESDPATTVSFRLGTFAKCSLRTRNAATADIRRLAVMTHLGKLYDAAQHGVVTLSQKQAVALSARVYRRLIRENDDNPGTAEQWEAWKGFTRAALEGRLPGGDVPVMGFKPRTEERAAAEWIFGSGDMTAGFNVEDAGSYDETALRERCGRLALWVLHEEGIEVDRPSHLRLLQEVARAALQAGWQLKRQAGGDYRPDPLADRFPALQTASSGLTLPGLFDRWRAETKPAPSTVSTWRGVVASLARHLRHDDVARITADDVVAWKDTLVVGSSETKALSAKTVSDTYLAGLRALLNYAVSNRLVAENVAKGIKVAAKRRAGERRLPYEDAELARLLALSAAETHPARRWIPLLLATSGARVGEIAQLWAERVRVIDGVPCMVLAPAEDGGSFKNEGSERTVPLHPAVIEAGFLSFVEAKGSGPLFYGSTRRKTRREDAKHASKGVSNHLATWIRDQGFTDPRKAPNHAIRHWWKTAALRAGVPDSLADAVQGHADGSNAGTYRHFETKTFAEAITLTKVPNQHTIFIR